MIVRPLAAGFLRMALNAPRVVVVVGGFLAFLVVAWLLLGRGASAPAGSDTAVGVPGSVSAASSVGVRSRGDEGPVPSVASYLQGMTTFDARLMWNALSEDALRQMQTQGGSLERLQASLDQAKQRGVRYDEVVYIGGYPKSDGGKFQFVVISRRGFDTPGQLEQVWFVFTIDATGKIIKID